MKIGKFITTASLLLTYCINSYAMQASLPQQVMDALCGKKRDFLTIVGLLTTLDTYLKDSSMDVHTLKSSHGDGIIHALLRNYPRAEIKGSLQLAKMRGIDFNELNAQGLSPLMLSATLGHKTAMMEKLISLGAKPNLMPCKESALDYAAAGSKMQKYLFELFLTPENLQQLDLSQLESKIIMGLELKMFAEVHWLLDELERRQISVNLQLLNISRLEKSKNHHAVSLYLRITNMGHFINGGKA